MKCKEDFYSRNTCSDCIYALLSLGGNARDDVKRMKEDTVQIRAKLNLQKRQIRIHCAVTVIWASPCFGHPRFQIPRDIIIPYKNTLHSLFCASPITKALDEHHLCPKWFSFVQILKISTGSISLILEDNSFRSFRTKFLLSGHGLNRGAAYFIVS